MAFSNGSGVYIPPTSTINNNPFGNGARQGGKSQ